MALKQQAIHLELSYMASGKPIDVIALARATVDDLVDDVVARRAYEIQGVVATARKRKTLEDILSRPQESPVDLQRREIEDQIAELQEKLRRLQPACAGAERTSGLQARGGQRRLTNVGK